MLQYVVFDASSHAQFTDELKPLLRTAEDELVVSQRIRSLGGRA
ncbi:hypothetical protein [Brevibacillus panacihumi]|nr:hypothetical protein [Brevibacillus panacihumi]